MCDSILAKVKNLELSVIKSYKFKWYDTGNPASLSEAKKKIKYDKYNILDKEGEAIWFTKNKKVIKYSNDKKFISRKRIIALNRNFSDSEYAPN